MAGDVSVVIPTFNGRDLLEKNLPSLVGAFSNTANRIKEIIIVDDGSTDSSVQFIKKNYSDVRIVRHTKNRRFPKSVNSGVRSAKSEYIALLNNDVEVTKDFLAVSLNDLEDEDVFAVSLHEKGYGGSKGEFVDGFIVYEGQKEAKKLTNTFWASGGSCIFKKKIFSELGGMDEELYTPFYWEDIDLSYRALKRGYRIVWEPKSLVYHNHESTNKKISKVYRARIQERNQLLFIWKNLTSYSYLRKHLLGLARRLIRHPGYVIIFIMAISKLRPVLRKRKREMKEAKVSDEAIFASFAK